jgi:type II secretory pathway pseudopilin PulG
MHIPRARSGFTVLEMTVSIGLFSVVVLMVFSTIISLSQEAKKAQASRTVVGNLGATIESMARGIRMGKYFYCFESVPTSATFTSSDILTVGKTEMLSKGDPDACPIILLSGGAGISPASGSLNDPPGGPDLNDHYFAFVPIAPGISYATIYRRNPTAMSIERSTDGGQTWQRFTSEDIKVDRLKFFLAKNGTGEQPYITTIIGGYTDENQPTESRFDVQMTVAARTPNN